MPRRLLSSAVIGPEPRKQDSRRGAGFLCAALAWLTLAGACSRPAERPPVVLITLDTTRQDHLSLYGYPRKTSPRLDELAASAWVYTHAYSTSSWTLPAHASLFTGKFPSSHGARYDAAGPLRLGSALGDARFDHYRARGLAQDERTLALLLQEAGYATGAVVAGPWMKRAFGLDRGFEFYDDAEISSLQGRSAESVTDAALRWVAERQDESFFLFLNYFDPHGPYDPPARFRNAFLPAPTEDEDTLKVAYYDAEILGMDHHLGRLLDELRARGIYDRAWIVVTADHGELLGEHGRHGHGLSLSEPEIRIPLIVKPPGSAQGREVSDPVQLLDVLPFLLENLGIPVPEGIQGNAPPLRHPVAAELFPLPGTSPDGDSKVLLHGPHKLVWTARGDATLFDLTRDPGEMHDVAAQNPDLVETCRRALLGYLETLPAPGAAGPERALDPETLEALRELGYLGQ